MIQVIKYSKRNMFVVVDSKKTFIGMILLDDVREDMFDQEKYINPISQYLYSPMDDDKVSINHGVQEIINKFNRTGNYNMVVLDDKKYIGIVSKANVLKAYRENMIADIDDHAAGCGFEQGLRQQGRRVDGSDRDRYTLRHRLFRPS